MANVYRVEYVDHTSSNPTIHIGTFSSIVKAVTAIKEHETANWTLCDLLPLNEAEIGDYAFGFKVVDPLHDDSGETVAQYNVSAYILNEVIEEFV